MCSRTGADLNIFAPSLGITMETSVVLSVPTTGLNLPENVSELKVEVLGQPETVVPAALRGDYVELTIPAEAWAKAVEYMPVIRVRGVAR